MASKMINCKTCGAEIAANAKVCPSCGAKNKQPFYKKWWFYALVVIVLIVAIGGSGGNGSGSSTATKAETQSKATTEKTESKPTPTPISYEHYDVKELFDVLNSNAMKAQSTFKGQYVEIEGYLVNIDSDGKYIDLGAPTNDYEYLFKYVQCYIKSDEQKSAVMEMGIDDRIIVRGKITDVGEVLGYSLNIDSIEKAG